MGGEHESGNKEDTFRHADTVGCYVIYIRDPHLAQGYVISLIENIISCGVLSGMYL